jgi:hypothetical protein
MKHELTKHISVDCFYVQYDAQEKIVDLQYICPRRFNLQIYQGSHSSLTLFFFSKLNVVDPP